MDGGFISGLGDGTLWWNGRGLYTPAAARESPAKVASGPVPAIGPAITARILARPGTMSDVGIEPSSLYRCTYAQRAWLEAARTAPWGGRRFSARSPLRAFGLRPRERHSRRKPSRRNSTTGAPASLNRRFGVRLVTS